MFLPLGLALGSPIFPSGCEGKLGVALESPQGDNSVGKESACNAGDPSSIPELGRSSGEGIGYPLQYSWASLVAQLVKNPPAMRETWVCFQREGQSGAEASQAPAVNSGSW